MRQRFVQALLYFFTAAGFLSVLLLFAAVICGLVYSGMRADIAAPFSLQWLPENGKYGIIPMITGTLITAFLAVLMSFPLSIGILSVIWVFDNKFSKFLRWLVRFMAGIPTVVYSFCGMFVLIPLFRYLFYGNGFSILIVSVVLAFLILPTITMIADSALYPVLSPSQKLFLTTSSLGMSREKSFFYVALPVQRKWLLTGALLGFSRAVGDTMIALMLSGNTPIMPSGILSSVRTLSGHISLLSATEISPQIEYTLFLSSFLLFGFSLAVNMFASLSRKQR